jgi:hypothetical protein
MSREYTTRELAAHLNRSRASVDYHIRTHGEVDGYQVTTRKLDGVALHTLHTDDVPEAYGLYWLTCHVVAGRLIPVQYDDDRGDAIDRCRDEVHPGGCEVALVKWRGARPELDVRLGRRAKREADEWRVDRRFGTKQETS